MADSDARPVTPAGRKALAAIARLTKRIEGHPQDFQNRLDQYDVARAEGVTFHQIAVAAKCSDSAVQLAIAKRRKRQTS